MFKSSFKPIFTNQYYLIGIFLLGLVSGFTFTLIFSTIPYQLCEAKYSTDVIGSITLTAFPYFLKTMWAPFIDKYSIPFLCPKFGQRRGWALTAQIFLTLSMISFLIIDPTYNLYITYAITFLISFSAATNDIIIDAYRIERASNKEELSLAITFSNIGFRLGILLSGVGALYISTIFDWSIVYKFGGILTLIGPIVILFIKEPASKGKRHTSNDWVSLNEYFDIIRKSTLSLIHSQPYWLLIILFIFLYKAADSVPMAMSIPLFLDLSFSAYEIASISKAYGLILMIIGGVLGGVLTSKIGIFYSMLIAGSMQLLSPVMFMILAIMGYNIPIFITTITVQNFVCGFAGTALNIYLSSLCNSEFVATQYSILASLSSFVRIILVAIAGFGAKYINWSQFFFINTLFSMLFIIVFMKIYKKQKNKN